MNLLVLFLLVISVSFAQVSTPPLPTEGSSAVPEKVKPQESKIEEVVENANPEVNGGPVQKKVKELEKEISSTRENRDDSFGTLMVGYQLVTSWLPSKKVISYTQIFNEEWSVEGEYSWSSVDDPLFWIDLGEIEEKRFNLQARRYVGNSFNFSFGAVYSQFSAHLGSDFLDQFGRELNSSFEAQNIGLTGGIGNRWQWSNGLTVGIDWLHLNVPVFETYVRDDVLDSISEDDEHTDIKNIIRKFNRLPTFVLFGLSLGYTF
ncbi:MAG: hypothetical protein ACLGHN_06805 [Bacteriovoracia bacterium]